MKTSARLSPISPSRVSSSLPAAPTNGSPCRSSLAPGASPTNIRSASALPAPNTTVVRVEASSAQRVHARACTRRSFSASRRSVAVAIEARVMTRYATCTPSPQGTDADRRTHDVATGIPPRELDRAMHDSPLITRDRDRTCARLRTVRAVAEVREALRDAPRPIGLVPTMGALHEGHLSLIERARADCATVVMSLFVNPTQFAAGEDLERYPRDEARDARLAQEARVDLLFAPAPSEMYPPGFATTIVVGGGLSEPLEGAVRGPE